MSISRWEHFPHEADMGLRGIASTKSETFEQAALATTAVVTDPVTPEAGEAVEVRCDAPDDELLLVDWFNALVFEMVTRRWQIGRLQVRIDHHRLSATGWGEPIDRERHQPGVEIKGATYTALRVAQENGHWIAQTVVDV